MGLNARAPIDSGVAAIQQGWAHSTVDPSKIDGQSRYMNKTMEKIGQEITLDVVDLMNLKRVQFEKGIDTISFLCNKSRYGKSAFENRA